MDLINNLSLGFGVAFNTTNLIYAFIGCLLGTLIGVLPGVGSPPSRRPNNKFEEMIKNKGFHAHLPILSPSFALEVKPVMVITPPRMVRIVPSKVGK